MNGSGCKNCPVKPCETMNYRGSTCSVQRAKLGLGDPKTKADRIRAMSDEELAASLAKTIIDAILHAHNMAEASKDVPAEMIENLAEEYLEWLKQPAEGE